MAKHDYGTEKPEPPSFEEATNLRQRARVAGLDPNYWYPAFMSRDIKPGEVKEVVFWRREFAVYRGLDGSMRCIENRCAHRNLKLSLGQVEGCTLRCAYHGWAYDGDGKLVDMPHNDFGRQLKVQLQSFPIQEKYGMIWIFPGDAAMATQRAIPTIPDIEGPDAWAYDVMDYHWMGHHSLILDNVSDFTHGYLHRKWRPFDGDELLGLEEKEDSVLLQYNSKIAAAKIMDLVIDRKQHAGTSHYSCYQYPYQWSNTEEFVKHWLFVWPESETSTRVFFLFYYRDFKVPFLPLKMPQKLMLPMIKFGHQFMVRPLFNEDGWAVAREQEAFQKHWDAPVAEVNPQVMAYQKLTVRKWEEYLASRDVKQIKKKKPAQKAENADA
jgi:nitrite reductase/ring-hydroxylating ferredoxin subunit